MLVIFEHLRCLRKMFALWAVIVTGVIFITGAIGSVPVWSASIEEPSLVIDGLFEKFFQKVVRNKKFIGKASLIEVSPDGKWIGVLSGSRSGSQRYYVNRIPRHSTGYVNALPLKWSAGNCSNGTNVEGCVIVEVGNLRFVQGSDFVFTAGIDDEVSFKNSLLLGSAGVVTGDALPSSKHRRYQLAVYPDGRIAYAMEGRIYVQWDLPPAAPVMINASVRADDSFPCWTPEGQGIIFSRRTPDDSFDLYLAKPNGVVRKLLDWPGIDEVQPSISPDGKYLTFVSNAGGLQGGQPVKGKNNLWRVYATGWNGAACGRVSDAMPGHHYKMGRRLEIPRLSWKKPSTFVFIDPLRGLSAHQIYLSRLEAGGRAVVQGVSWPNPWKSYKESMSLQNTITNVKDAILFSNSSEVLMLCTVVIEQKRRNQRVSRTMAVLGEIQP